MTAWAFATLNIRNEPLMEAFAQRLMWAGALTALTPQDTSLAAWSFATLGIRNEEFMGLIAERTTRPEFVSSFNSQDLAVTAWAFATLDLHNADLMAAIAQRTLQPGVLKTFTSQGIAMTAWAFASQVIRVGRDPRSARLMHELTVVSVVGCGPPAIPPPPSRVGTNGQFAGASAPPLPA